MQDPDEATNRGAAEPYRPKPDRGLAPTDLRTGPPLAELITEAIESGVEPVYDDEEPHETAARVDTTSPKYRPGQWAQNSTHGELTTVDPGQVIDLDKIDPELAAQLAESRHHPEQRIRRGRPKPRPNPDMEADPTERALTDLYRAALYPEPTQDHDEIAMWWQADAAEEAPEISRKAREYGSNSLAAMGRMFARAQRREVDHQTALELGCIVYMYGKMERTMDAVYRGEQPGKDSIRDLSVYARMILRIRETGNWP